MWTRKRNAPRREAFDWPVRWRDAVPPLDGGTEAEIAAAFAAAACDVPVSSEIDRQRAWARLRAAVRPAPLVRSWVPALGVAAVALVVFGVFVASPRDDSGLRQVVLRPAVSADPQAANAVLGGEVAVGTPIRTASDTIATVELDTVGVLLLRSDTQVSARPIRGRVAHVQLERGEVVARLQHESPLGLVVDAGAVEVRVTGTVFGVRSRPGGTLVRVWRGSVVVREDGRAFKVRAGERYEHGEVTGQGASDRLERRAATLIGWLDGVDDEGVTEAPPIGAQRAAEVVAPGPDPVPVGPVSRPPEPQPVRVALAEPRSPAPLPAPSRHREVARAVEPSAETPRERELRLQALSRGDAPEAATALYALAALRFDVMGDRRGAVQAWSDYVARFPEGPLAADALRQLFEALLAAGDAEAALALGRRAVAQASSPERERVALRLAETLHRRLARPEEAVVVYRQLVEDGGASPEADRAAYLLIDALQRAGRTADAHDALDAYLQRFPAGVYVREVQAERRRWLPDPTKP